ncbi:unnamed protein product [Amoebophrya sp. A120]|nr:unnamed protein product [Amoebophrya sp. A120]|eukprot:GSA120T00019113001.1
MPETSFLAAKATATARKTASADANAASLQELAGFGIGAASAAVDTQPSVHTAWQLWQDGKLSKKQFVDALGGELPLNTLKLLNQVDCTYAEFVKSFGRENSFASQRAGGRTQYRDSAGALISDNSAPAPAVRVIEETANYRRASSDVSRMAERSATFKVRKANDVSRNNPLIGGSALVADEANLSEQEAHMQSAIRMFLDGELKSTEMGEFVCSLRNYTYNPRQATSGMPLKVHTLLERHQVNGPFGFRYLAQTFRDILLETEPAPAAPTTEA